jgi:RNA polymerase sigma-70 factor (sigma-E family)
MEGTLTVEAVMVVARPDDDAEFADFFGASWPRLFRTTYAVAGDRASAEDALQSAYARAYASWRRVRAAEHPEAYVRRMAVNEVLNVRRRSWWRAEQAHAELPEPLPEPEPEPGAADGDAVWAAVRALPPRQRAVVVLRYYEGLSEAEIADALGCSRGTVKSQAYDALRNLRSSDLGIDLDPSRDPAPGLLHARGRQ